MSLRFPAELRSRVKRFAATRGLEEATAVRTLCAERLAELDRLEDVRAAEQWQLAQARESFERLERGELKTVAPADLHRLLDAARRGSR